MAALFYSCAMSTEITPFQKLLHDQISNEFAASQQYIAMAVYYDGTDMPQLAKHFYAQAVEERNHAMMIVQYFLDRDMAVDLTGVDRRGAGRSQADAIYAEVEVGIRTGDTPASERRAFGSHPPDGVRPRRAQRAARVRTTRIRHVARVSSTPAQAASIPSCGRMSATPRSCRTSCPNPSTAQ